MDAEGVSWVEMLLAAKRAGSPANRSNGTGDELIVTEGVGSREIVLPDEDDAGTDGRGDRSQILLVEDDSRFAELVERILADEAPEFEVVRAVRITAALARLARHPIRLILTD